MFALLLLILATAFANTHGSGPPRAKGESLLSDSFEQPIKLQFEDLKSPYKVNSGKTYKATAKIMVAKINIHMLRVIRYEEAIKEVRDFPSKRTQVGSLNKIRNGKNISLSWTVPYELADGQNLRIYYEVSKNVTGFFNGSDFYRRGFLGPILTVHNNDPCISGYPGKAIDLIKGEAPDINLKIVNQTSYEKGANQQAKYAIIFSETHIKAFIVEVLKDDKRIGSYDLEDSDTRIELLQCTPGQTAVISSHDWSGQYDKTHIFWSVPKNFTSSKVKVMVTAVNTSDPRKYFSSSIIKKIEFAKEPEETSTSPPTSPPTSSSVSIKNGNFLCFLVILAKIVLS